MKITLHPDSKVGKVVKAYMMAGFKPYRIIEQKNGLLTAYIAGRGVRVFINSEGQTRFVGRQAA